MANGFFDKVYATRDTQETRELYDGWSASYEAEVAEHGYITPRRCAEALAAHASDQLAPVLDFGCGTGLSGLALKLAGFATLDGVDVSAEMLEKAARKRIYRDLSQIDAETPFDPEPGKYAAIASIGAIGAGAAPISVFHRLMTGLGSGGKLVFSLNDHALQDRSNEAGLCEWLDCGAARLLFKEYGPHLPGLDIKATVYVIEKK